MFEMLFSPITINKTEIKNRIAYPSLGLLYSLDGKLNDKYRNFYLERARGGAGIVTVGPVGFDFVGSGPVALQLADDEAIKDFAELTGMIKDAGARAWVQLFHAGAYSYSKLMGGEDPIAPSAVYSNYTKAVPREMTIEDIKATQKAFVDAAARAKEAGFDGVEIIASAGYLITQFISPLKNQRTDEYGGSFENRMRFPREIIEMMRERLGADYPISIRMAGNDFVPDSNTDEDTPAVARAYEKPLVASITNLLEGGAITLDHLFELRLMLEPPAAARAASHASPEGLAELERALAQAEQVINDSKALRVANLEFHRRLVAITGNSLLSALCDTVLQLLVASLEGNLSIETSRAVLDYHHRIVEAIRQKQPERARSLTEGDLAQLWRRYQDMGVRGPGSPPRDQMRTEGKVRVLD